MKKLVMVLLAACHHVPAKAVSVPPPPPPTLEVDVSGLTSGTLTLADAAATLTITADGKYDFTSPGAAGVSYNVTITSEPQGQACTVSGGTGTLAAGATSIATVTCEAQQQTSGNSNTIVVTPPHPFLAAGVSQQMTATLHLVGGATSDVTASVVWSSSDASRIAISSTGLATFVKLSATGVTLTATDTADAASGSASTPPVKVAFATSKIGKGKLGDWPDANGQIGIAAGDAICSALGATFGGAPFKAWLSDRIDTDDTDAYCHVMGRDQATCYASAGDVGPWVRPDGFPFAGGIDELTKNDAIYTPVRFDETGTELPDSTLIFTGTFSNGVGSTSVCAPGGAPVAWTDDSAGSDALVGWSQFTADNWTEPQGGEAACILQEHLLCLQTGAGGALPAFKQPGKIVFASSAVGDGNLSDWQPFAGAATGVAAGDAICQSLATSAGFTGTFKAWLSDDSTNAIDHVTGTGPWVLPDGIPVIASLTDLTTGNMFTAINETDKGTYLHEDRAWTGTEADGTEAIGANGPETCTQWTLSDVGTCAHLTDPQCSAFVGDTNVVGSQTAVYGAWWSHYTDDGCSQSNFHLYCFQTD